MRELMRKNLNEKRKNFKLDLDQKRKRIRKEEKEREVKKGELRLHRSKKI